jgi:transcriptional regulator GlxA family with amidase domain
MQGKATTAWQLAKVADRLDDRVPVAKICAWLGVAPRTLHMHCLVAFGMSPARYLRQRRLCRARAALLAGDPYRDSVTAIALRFGFTEQGRFSVAYREAFGERPIDTLRTLKAA